MIYVKKTIAEFSVDNEEARIAIGNLIGADFSPKAGLEALTKDTPYLADVIYTRPVEWITEFDQKLDSAHEVGLKIASFGSQILLVVRNIGYQNPNLLFFSGLVNGKPAELVQHTSQLNFLMVAVPRENPSEPKLKLGFDVD